MGPTRGWCKGHFAEAHAALTSALSTFYIAQLVKLPAPCAGSCRGPWLFTCSVVARLVFDIYLHVSSHKEWLFSSLSTGCKCETQPAEALGSHSLMHRRAAASIHHLCREDTHVRLVAYPRITGINKQWIMSYQSYSAFFLFFFFYHAQGNIIQMLLCSHYAQSQVELPLIKEHLAPLLWSSQINGVHILNLTLLLLTMWLL